VPFGDIEERRVALATVLIDVIVDGDLGVGLEIEGGGIDEGDAERRIRAGLNDVVEIDVVLDLERCGLVVADHAGLSGHGGDIADRLLRRLRIRGWRGWIGRRLRGLSLGLRLRQLRRLGRGRGNITSADRHVAGQQQEREEKRALHQGIPGRERRARARRAISAAPA
jgi:hypothetical protein